MDNLGADISGLPAPAEGHHVPTRAALNSLQIFQPFKTPDLYSICDSSQFLRQGQ